MKKKLVCLLLALAMLLALAACSIGGETTEQPAEEEKTSTEQTPAAEETTEEAAETEQPAETLAETFADSSAKIGIMTTTVTSSEEQFRLATQIQEKYGADKIIVQTYPDAISEVETTINNAMMLASDPDCKAIIFCQAMTGTIAAIEKIRRKKLPLPVRHLMSATSRAARSMVCRSQKKLTPWAQSTSCTIPSRVRCLFRSPSKSMTP